MGNKGFPSGSAVNSSAKQETQKMRVQPPRQENSLKKGPATHSSSCTENPMDRGAWQAMVHGVAELDTSKATEHACMG